MLEPSCSRIVLHRRGAGMNKVNVDVHIEAAYRPGHLHQILMA